jgi:hypothetical protein
MDANEQSGYFDAHYYAHNCGRPYQRDEAWQQFFGNIADRIVSDIEPATVLDAGCAWGFLVEALRQRDVEAYGLDISEYAIQNVHPDIKPYCWVGSVSDPFPQNYDLIVSIEVLEHMPQKEAEKTVENFCQHTDHVLFSSTPFDYKEATHFNVHPPEYWAELFARQGFFREVDFDASFVTPWAVHFRRKNEPLVKMVREYERKFFLLWKENADLRSLTVEMRAQLSNLDAAVQELRGVVDQKEQQLASQHEKFVEKLGELEVAHNQLGDMNNQLRDITGSTSWQTIQRLQAFRRRIIPLGSSRERLLFKLLGKKP